MQKRKSSTNSTNNHSYSGNDSDINYDEIESSVSELNQKNPGEFSDEDDNIKPQLHQAVRQSSDEEDNFDQQDADLNDSQENTSSIPKEDVTLAKYHKIFDDLNKKYKNKREPDWDFEFEQVQFTNYDLSETKIQELKKQKASRILNAIHNEQ